MGVMGVVITDQPRHLSEPLRPPPGFQALATAVAPAAVAATPDAVPTVVAVTLSDNQTDDAVPTAVAVPLSDSQTDDDVPRSRTTRSMTSRKYAVRPTNVKAVRPKKAQRPVPKTSPFVVTRTGLQTAGLYERVGADHPPLRELDQYMQKSSGCNSSQYRRGLANHVHRLHHFIQKTPENPTVLEVNAMMDPRKVEAFIEEFGRHTKGCGKKFLEKNIKRYLGFLRDKYEICFENRPLYVYLKHDNATLWRIIMSYIRV